MSSWRKLSATIAVLACGVTGAITFVAPAGAEAPGSAAWAGSGVATVGPPTVARVVASGLTGSAVFAYDNLARGTGGPAAGSWEFTSTATGAGPLTLDYRYDGFHAYFQVTVTLTAVVIRGGTVVASTPLVADGPIDCCTPPSSGFEYAGTYTFDLQAGDVFGFAMSGSNGDSNAQMSGRLVVGAPGSVHADTVVLNGYDVDRTQSEWSLTGTYLTTARGYLQDPDGFGPAGKSPTDYIIADGIDVASAQTLVGTDAFFTGYVSTDSYTPAEKAALVGFVTRGGSLIATTDDSSYTMVDAFGLTQGDGTTNPSSFIDAGHPIANGPFGTDTTYVEYASVGHYSSIGPNAVEVARNGAGQTTLAEILPGTLGPRSGLALFVSDVDFFSDTNAGAGFTGAVDNELLIGNLFAYVADSRRPAPSEVGSAQLFQAVPASDGSPQVAVAAQVTGPPDSTQDLTLVSSDTCANGVLGTATDLAAFSVAVGPTGETIFADAVAVSSTPGNYAALRVGPPTAGTTTACVVAGPANDSWIRALQVPLTVDVVAQEATGSAAGFLDSLGNSRWFRFDIRPGSRVTVDLTSLPDDYDLALFTDIAQAFVDVDDVDDLNQLGAEFAPSVFSPSVFSPSVFSPSVFSPDAYAPSVFSPSVFSPSVFSPSVFSPSVFSPSVFSPSVFSPSVFSPSVFSPSVFSPSVFSPSVFSPSVFSPDNFASAQTRSLIAVSAAAGTGDELVIADTWSNTGQFYVRVTGKNGEYDLADPFQLDVVVDGVDCVDVTPIAPAGGPAPDAGGYSTLILHDPARLDGALTGNDAAARAELDTNLAAYAARTEVAGKIVDLGAYSHIAALHTQADENSACPYAENLLASAIKEIVDGYRALNPTLEYITIVGSDAQVPFFRYPDQALLGPEQDYEPPVADLTQSQSALRRNYILGQDEYGASRVINLAAGRFPLPQLAVGRIVESATDMNTVLDAYLGTTDGVVDTPTSSLVTGYDFLTDAAEGVQSELVAGTNPSAGTARNDTLITAADISPDDPLSWTADQLRAELLDEGEDLVFLAGHFSANSTLAADYTTTALATELAASDVDLWNSIVFSAGCHSGYNIVDGDAVPFLTEPLDWTQAFAQQGATLIAGTGYQYGDTDFVEYSERLYVLFAQELRRGTGAVSVGQALARAKQEYLATTPEIRGLHRKSVLISTVFGLPNLKVDMPGERLPADPGGSSVVPNPETTDPGQTLGLQTADVTFDFTGQLSPQTVALTNLDDPGNPIVASYVRGPDGVVTNPAEPALPLVRADVSVTGLSLRGVGFRGGSWSEDQIVPLTGAPTTELRGVHTPFASTVNFPMRLATPNYFGALTGTGGTGLSLTPVQHRVAQIGDVLATRRAFGDLGLRLYYSNNTATYGANTPALAAPPTFAGVQALRDGDDVLVRARVVGDPAAGIQSVWVTYTDGSQSSGTWVSLDLTQDSADSTRWSGRIVGGASLGRLDFMVQAANGVGLVTLDDNFGAYYSVLGTVGETPTPPTATTLTVTGPSAATYGDTIPVSATLTATDGTPLAGESVILTLGGSGRSAVTDASGVARAGIPVTATPGNYRLVASYAGAADLARASAKLAVSVARASTTLQLIGGAPKLTPQGVDPGVGALLSSNGAPLLQRTVVFDVTGAGGSVRVARITDNLGRARLGPLPLPGGTYTVTAAFAPDPVYRPAVISGEFSLPRPPEVSATSPISVDEGASVIIAATEFDPDGDALTYVWSGGSDAVATLDDATVLTPTVRGVDDGTTAFTLVASDDFFDSLPAEVDVVVTNVAPTIDVFEVPIDPVEFTAPVDVTVAVSDVGVNDVLTTTIDWGDGTDADIVAGSTADHVYAAPGVYELTLEVCDDDEGCATARSDYVVVYDPSAGFVTGGGWIWSAPGAVIDQPDAEGKANFGFVSKYKKGATIPTGNTNFQLKAGDIHFESTVYEWLVVFGSKGQFWGQGTINGGGSYDFSLTAVDGDPSTFRLQIWNNDGGGLVYDTQRGAGATGAGAPLGGGSIKIHTPNGKK